MAVKKVADSKTRVAWSTDPTWYTVMYRKKGSRKYFRCGYRSQNINDMRDIAYDDIRAGRYASAKIVNWNTEEMIEKVM